MDNNSDENQWLSISDLMSGLMMVFLFIAIAYMIDVNKSKEKLAKIALRVQEYDTQLNKDLKAEFKDDLQRWNAEILSDNTFRFKSPDVLFDRGSSVLKPKFQMILSNFFPRYVNLLTSQQYISEIDELRIEGHTSSYWNSVASIENSYLNNMQLSQDRAKTVLNYSFQLIRDRQKQQWLIQHLRANGLAFAKKIINKDGLEDLNASKRVEFKVFTKTKEKIYKILETAS